MLASGQLHFNCNSRQLANELSFASICCVPALPAAAVREGSPLLPLLPGLSPGEGKPRSPSAGAQLRGLTPATDLVRGGVASDVLMPSSLLWSKACVVVLPVNRFFYPSCYPTANSSSGQDHPRLPKGLHVNGLITGIKVPWESWL